MNRKDLIIIGSGPAGLSAAVYGKRAGLDLIIMEKAPMSGGQVLNTYEVDNYLGIPGAGGFELSMNFRDHADKLGAEFVDVEVLSLEVVNGEGMSGELEAAWQREESEAYIKVHTTEGDFETKNILLATGAVHATLGVPGEEEFSGRGVSYCATCDGAFFREKTVAVVGGGDVALEDAIFLSRFCKKVYLIHRRDELRGAKILQKELFSKENVEVLYFHTVKEIQGSNMVTGVVLQDLKTGETHNMEIDGVFIAVGIVPHTELVRELVECDEKGYVIAGEDCVTNVPGIYVAGDARKKPLRQIITAVADGANAVTSIGMRV